MCKQAGNSTLQVIPYVTLGGDIGLKIKPETGVTKLFFQTQCHEMFKISRTKDDVRSEKENNKIFQKPLGGVKCALDVKYFIF